MKNQNNKKVLLTVMFVAILTIAVIGTSFAFFNYTRTGASNTIKVGRISFNHTQDTTITLTNIFPMSSEEIANDTNPANNITINIEGDTTYSGGIEYLVTAEDVNITVGDKKLPLNLYVSSTTDLGDNDPDYFTNRGGNTSIHKVLSGGVVIPGQYLVVGYIAPGQTKVDGSLNIKAYIDSSKIKITDTYDGTESDEMGTTNEWVGNKTVFTTDEWNSFQESGQELSFKIRVEANLGTWVDEATTPNLMNTIPSNLKTNVTEVRFIQASPINIQRRYDAAETKADLTYQETGKVLAWTEEKEVTPTGASNSLNDIKPSFLVNENTDNNVKQIDNEKEYILYIASSGSTKLNTGEYLFGGMSKVRKFVFENIDTSAVTNMSFMFSGCSSLTSIDLKEFDTSNVTDMSQMFVSCNSLTNIDFLRKLNMSNVTTLYNMFCSCSSLTIVDISYLNMTNVTNMSQMFAACSNLVSINLSDLGSDNLTNISQIFGSCSKLQEIDMSNFNFGNITSLSGINNIAPLGNGLSSLKKINLSGANASKTTIITRMFDGYSSLEEVDMSGFIFGTSTGGLFGGNTSIISINLKNVDTSTVTNMQTMFAGCSNLTNIDLSYFDTRNVTSMSQMFAGCSSLTKIDLSDLGSSELMYIKGIFDGCIKLEEINMSNFNFGNTNMLYGGALGSGLSALKKINLSGANASKNTDGLGEMFKGWLSLEEVDMSGFIFGTSTNNMFGDNTSITTINLENADTSNVIDMRSMFNGCNSLTIINLNGINTSKVIDMQTMFAGCSSLTNIDLSDFDTSNVAHMAQMFSGCSNLVSINLSNLGSPKLTDIYRIFDNCIKLKEINMKNFNFGNITSLSTSNNYTLLGNGLSSLKKINLSGANASKTTSMKQFFIECSSLEEVDMSRFIFGTSISLLFAGNSSIISINLKDADTSNVNNMQQMFSDCSNLTSLNLNGLNTSNVTNMAAIFLNCNSLTNLNLVGLDTSNVTSMAGMFYGCTNLTTIMVGSGWNVSNITSSDNMFYNCTHLVGGNGTVFDSTKTDKTMAVIDTPTTPGYLTLKTS